MRPSRRPLIIASRRSPLARVQAEFIAGRLRALHPAVAVEFRWIESEGDQRTDVALAEEGGKGLFTRAVEQAVLTGRADLAVHSLKDLPADPPGRGGAGRPGHFPESGKTQPPAMVRSGAQAGGLVIAAIPARADFRDCLLAHGGAATLQDLPRGGAVGTASPRRAAQVKRQRPDLKIELLRGNVETRIRRVMEEHRFDATLLAVAGLTRLGLERYANHPLDTSVMLPAAGQGALALQCRSNDHVTLLRCLPLNDPVTAEAVHAERAIIAALRGDCHSPIAVLAEPATVEGHPGYRVRVRVLSPDPAVDTMIELDEQATSKQLRRLIRQMLETLRERGCESILRPRG